ncbi:MAG: DMT family transporter [Paludibacter sp.]|jgi:drug/metabolite transporter (DMT)-like permease|nr:DMT family transporter [Paludibacter sp.]
MDKNKRNGHLALLLANIFFGLNNPVSRSMMPELMSPYVLTFFRLGGGAALFWLCSLFVKREHIPLKDIGLLFVAAILCHTINLTGFFVGLSQTTSIDASIVVTLLPVISMLLAAVIIKEPITFKKAFGVFVGASGALLLVLGKHGGEGLGTGIAGDLIVLAAVTSFALYITVFKGLISKYSVVSTMKWMFLFASLQSYPFCHADLMATDFASFSPSVWWRLAYMVVIATFVSYLLLVVGQKSLRPTTLAMYNYVQPIIASLAAVAWGMGKLGFLEFLSAALVFTGVYFVTQSKSRAQMEAEKALNSKELS